MITILRDSVISPTLFPLVIKDLSFYLLSIDVDKTTLHYHFHMEKHPTHPCSNSLLTFFVFHITEIKHGKPLKSPKFHSFTYLFKETFYLNIFTFEIT